MVNRQRIVLAVSVLLILTFFGICYAVKLHSIYHCKHYNRVKHRMENQKTENHIFPDTLFWSKGGEEKFGLRLLIHCERNNRMYSGDLIGIRSGILNCANEDIHLALAYYSPNKHRIPPEYTLYVDGPEAAVLKERGRVYMGDDAIHVGERLKPALFEISSGKIFNPSPDSFYYNAWNGILHLTESGVYKIWCSYSFDSLTSNIPVEEITTLYSDTIEIIMKWDPCSGCIF